jgi:hypothetical protein
LVIFALPALPYRRSHDRALHLGRGHIRAVDCKDGLVFASGRFYRLGGGLYLSHCRRAIEVFSAMTLHDKAIEAAAKAMKAVMCKQLEGVPLLGDTKSGDWAATGGSIDFTELFEIGFAAYLAALEAEGGARRGHAFVDSNGGWASGEYPPSPDEFPVLIIKTE